ncbi:tol-pal system-associated acyl-CoA thioesterase [Aliikangiella sp. IMCC44359]|uniref:tol-pal system-associated acyl-CoA thioesterase n=1 Tax=Aliikangiella sp. IMCC44359 TaxID=3459125 RepID=UPI00403B1EB1
MLTEFIWPLRVYYEDTDAGGVVYHANYLKYFERARSEWLEKIGVDQTQLLANNTVFAVQKADIEYLKPARLHEELDIVSSITQVRGASFNFEQKLYRHKERQQTLCKANIQIVCLKLDSFTPCRIPAAVKEELQRVS